MLLFTFSCKLLIGLSVFKDLELERLFLQLVDIALAVAAANYTVEFYGFAISLLLELQFLW